MVKLICLRCGFSASAIDANTSPLHPLILSHHADDDALHLYLVGIDHQRLHRRVGGLQADTAVLPVELLQRHVEPAEQRDHHFAVVRRLAVLDDDEIAVADLLVDHRIAPDAQHIRIALAGERFRNRDRLRSGNRLDWRTGGDKSQQGKFQRPSSDARRDEFHRPASIPCAPDEPLLLKIREMLVHGRERRQVEASPDLLEARRVAVVLDELVQVIQDFALTFCERKHHWFPPVGRGGTIMRTECENQLRVRGIRFVVSGGAGCARVLHSKRQPWRNSMRFLTTFLDVARGALGGRRKAVSTAIFGLILAVAPLQAGDVSKQQADVFARKVEQIVVQGNGAQRPGARRTPVSESELNSWFAYGATPLLPAGVSDPRITMVGNGKVMGRAVVDLDAIAKRKSTGGTFDLWSLVGGKVPV